MFICVTVFVLITEKHIDVFKNVVIIFRLSFILIISLTSESVTTEIMVNIKQLSLTLYGLQSYNDLKS